MRFLEKQRPENMNEFLQKFPHPIVTRLGRIVGGAKPKVQCEN
jgi:hypothetical protein